MFPRPASLPPFARLIVWMGLVWLSVGPAIGETIKLRSGVEYQDVTILRQDATTLKIRTRFGEISLSTASVASIDGKRYVAPGNPPAAPPAVVATPAEPASTPAPVPSGDEPVSISVATPPISAPGSPVAPPPAASKAATRPYVHDWKMETRLGFWLAVIVLWICHLLIVQYDLNRRRDPAAHLWNSIVLFLPGLGLVLYLGHRVLAGLRPKTASQGIEDTSLRPADPKSRGLRSFLNFKAAKGSNLEFVDAGNQPLTTNIPGADSSILDIAREILAVAVVQQASDIHIEPQEQDYRVRLRVDGQLAELRTLASITGLRLVSALKTVAEIDIAEKRKAQDGRFRVRTDQRQVDFRLATAGSIHGEKVVIRILDRQSGIFSLDQLGMAPAMESAFDQTIHSRSGMIIVTGPTGSGKTSTLYAALTRLDLKTLNVMTIEDPVEYELAGATQLPVLIKAGVTYESGLRSILRQDPDVILVGEMRDSEAAAVALRAALTGHMVFTSLHTRNSISTLLRLEEMGLDRTQISSALLMLVAQRLVRILCPACRQPVVCEGSELSAVDLDLPAGETIWQPGGCPQCEGSGYRGRTAIFELLIINESIRRAIATGAGEEAIYALARENGFENYREAGARKVLAGITSVAEILEAT